MGTKRTVGSGLEVGCRVTMKCSAIAPVGVRIDPPQHFLEVRFDGLIAEAGVQTQRVGVAHQDSSPPRFQQALRLEGLDHPAGIGERPTPRRVASCSWVRGTVLLSSARSMAEMIHFAVRCSIEWMALHAVDWNICAIMQSA